MLLFAAHPGLAVFPAALSGLCQLQLMRAALQDWPQPPARTNHTAVYGDLLCGLFQAAQAGLSLQQQQQEDEQLGSCQAQCQQPQQEEQLDNRQQQQQQQQQQHQQQEDRLDDGQTQYHHQQQQQHCEDSRSSPQPPTDVVWSGTGRGPKAALLLRKLRWVCLGPPYDWTRRMYDTHLRHTQLPPGLAALARHFAALAAAAAAGEGPAAGAGHVPAARAEFVPDAALVNYYHPGDTLNGHRDDVEPDLAQPIVTLSLGCDAVFLKGAESRDVAPSALLLRSGDVVVLGGRARRCYHGVPRVFDGWQVPNGVAAAAEAQQQSYGAVVQHMRNSRINVSIRAIH